MSLILLSIFGLVLVAYSGFEASAYLHGPRIVLSTAAASTIVSEPEVTVSGAAAHITSLSLNGSDVPVTTDGHFAVPFLLSPGDNRIMLDAKDAYGRAQTKVVEYVYKPDEATSI